MHQPSLVDAYCLQGIQISSSQFMVADLYHIQFVVFSLFRDEKTTKLQNNDQRRLLTFFLRQKRQIELQRFVVFSHRNNEKITICKMAQISHHTCLFDLHFPSKQIKYSIIIHQNNLPRFLASDNLFLVFFVFI